MATVFKRPDRKNYQVAWIDADGRRHEKTTGTSDHRTALRIAAKLDEDAALVRAGLLDPRQAAYAKAERAHLSQHIADFELALKAKDNTPGYVAETVENLRRIARLAKAERISDLTPSTVQRAIQAARGGQLSLRTCEKLRRSMKGFTAWLHRERRCREDPLLGLSGYRVETDRRRVRREFLPQELDRMIHAAETGEGVLGMQGVDRAMLYRLAAGSGFRRGELASLRPEDFRLECDPPVVVVRAGYSKRRREDTQPLPGWLADCLQPWLATKPPGVPVFRLPGKKTAALVRADLAVAREGWIDEAKTPAERRQRSQSDFLAVHDPAGRVLDFHGLRHTFVSSIVRGGASVKVAQELARHASPATTFAIYAHVRLHDLTGALDALPDLTPKPPAGAAATNTGTEG